MSQSLHSSRRSFFKAAGAAAVSASAARGAGTAAQGSGREYWISQLTRITHPVLLALSRQTLKIDMPVEAASGQDTDRKQFTYLEALGRSLAGLSSWLESGGRDGSEGLLRAECADLARRAISAAVDPDSPDSMNFSTGSQPVVDAAFLAVGLLRAPQELWHKLDSGVQDRLVRALKATRAIRPGFNNWLLFSAAIEAFFSYIGESWDAMRVDYAIRQHEEWYKGDGIYGDGPEFHWDYYNSFVIHPMLLKVMETVAKRSKTWDGFYPAAVNRAKRYAAIQERLIAPDGSFPAIGRSLAYRCGAFHLLADMASREQLPDGVLPEQVRPALEAVIRRTLEAPGTFDAKGWLTVGLCGHQPALGETYISTGSLYLCSTAFLPLGLAATNRFWEAPAQLWTSRKIWSGKDVQADHHLISP